VGDTNISRAGYSGETERWRTLAARLLALGPNGGKVYSGMGLVAIGEARTRPAIFRIAQMDNGVQDGSRGGDPRYGDRS
jgi:hypothetical protein